MPGPSASAARIPTAAGLSVILKAYQVAATICMNEPADEIARAANTRR